MKSGDRDLLIMLNESKYSRIEIEREATLITHMLTRLESSQSRNRAVELIDFNRNRIFTDEITVSKVLNQLTLRPFQFLYHKN